MTFNYYLNQHSSTFSWATDFFFPGLSNFWLTSAISGRKNENNPLLPYSDALLAPSDAFSGPLKSREAACVWQKWAVNLSA